MIALKHVLAVLVVSASLGGCETPRPVNGDHPSIITTPIGRDRYGLAAAWHQTPEECGDAQPVRELLIRADGTYSVTWLPFESYQDYWGHWRYEPQTHTLTFTVAGGNYVPTDRVDSGQVSVDTQTLTLGAISLGSPHEGPRCTAAFHHS